MFEKIFTSCFVTELFLILLSCSVFLRVSSNQYEYYPQYQQEREISSSTPRGIRETRVSLSAEIKPQYVFTLHETDTEFAFEISKDAILPGEYAYRDFKISIVVEKMSCHKMDGREPAFLVIQGKTETLKYCQEIDNEKNSFQTVKEVMDGQQTITVRTEGDWTGLSAKLVASIYYEVTDGCSNCDDGYFCCGYQGSTCAASRRFHPSFNYVADPLYRCIPMRSRGGEDRNNDLICNRHPNCGFFCNADESRATCGNLPDNCVGADCNLADVALRIAILIVFCFLLPPILILFLCRFKAVRNLCERLNSRVSNRFRHRGDSQDSTDESGAEVTRRQRNPTHVYNPEEDLPPSYEDYLRNFKQPNPPAFEEIVGPTPTVIDINGNPDRTDSELSNQLPHQCSNCGSRNTLEAPLSRGIVLVTSTLPGVDNLAFVSENRHESQS